jgi:hypothetical protein
VSDGGQNATASKSLTSYSLRCGTLTGDPTSAIEAYSSGNSGLQYLGSGNWQYNRNTDKACAGTCRTMVLTLNDNTTHSANLKFK